MIRKPKPERQAALTGPFYEPPYEGALQDEFAWHVVKYLREDARLASEVDLEVETARGHALFKVDFILEAGGRLVAVECGGERNLRDHQRRLRRDAALVASGAVGAVYRLRGSDLLDHMEDCLYLIATWEQASGGPDLFSERGRINLDTLATREAKNLRLRPEQAAAMVTYEIDPEKEEYFSERHLWHAANGTNPFILLRRFDARFAEAWEAHVDEALAARAPRLRPTGS